MPTHFELEQHPGLIYDTDALIGVCFRSRVSRTGRRRQTPSERPFQVTCLGGPGGRNRTVQHLTPRPLQLKPARADAGVGQSICIRFTTPSPARLHDAHRDTTGSSAAALQWLRVFDEEKACCSPAGRSCIASTRATLWRGHALVVGEHDLHFTGAML